MFASFSYRRLAGTNGSSRFLALLYGLGKRVLSLKMGLIYLSLLALSLAPLSALPSYFYHLLSFVPVVGKLIYPSLLAALIVIKTTTIYELVHGLRKWRLPEVWLLTFAVMFRFCPSSSKKHA